MALKLDVQWWRDADGNLVVGDTSIVTCSDDDPHRLQTASNKDVQPEDIPNWVSPPEAAPKENP